MSRLPNFFALIPAAGHGARMGLTQPKQYEKLAGQRVIDWTVQALQQCPHIAHIYVVVAPDDEMLQSKDGVTVLHCGGATRRDSVLNALEHLSDTLHAEDWLLVHDAARPGITPALVQRLIGACEHDAAGGLLALPVADTLKRALKDTGNANSVTSVQSANETVRVQTTLPREQLWVAQTPQMFRYGLLHQALQQHPSATDEASAVETLGWQPRLVVGHARNLKITYPADLALAELFLTSDLT